MNNPQTKPSTNLDRMLVTLTALTVVAGLCWKVDYSGAWDGDPSIHARHAMEAVNVFVSEWRNDGDVGKSFLHCYFAFPKMLHEILLMLFTLTVNGVEPIDFGDIEYHGAWFATVFALAGSMLMFVAARSVATLPAALVAVLLSVFSGYFLLYANFPRHNMPSHVFAWTVWCLYAWWRGPRAHLTLRQGAVIGLLFGAAIPVHYSAAYVIFAPVAAEIALALWDRRYWKQTLGAFAMMGLASLAVPALLEAYFHLYAHLYPQERDWWGYVISKREYSFVDGMLTTLNNLGNRTMEGKLQPHDWLFLPGFIRTSYGYLAGALMVIGVTTAAAALLRARGTVPTTHTRRSAIILVTLVLALAISLQFFQNARKLAVFYPAFAALIALGVDALLRPLPHRHRGVAGAVALALIATLHAFTKGPDLRDVWQARRDSGFMREYLAAHHIDRILVMPQWVASQMAPQQVSFTVRKATGQMTVSQTAEYDYVVFHRLFPAAHGSALLDCVRRFEPVVRFPNQVSLPLFYYEFPLTPEFMDFSDPLTNSRALYAWAPIRAACAHEFIARKRLQPDS